MIASLSREIPSLLTSIFSFFVIRVLNSPLSYENSPAPIMYMAELFAFRTGGPAIREIQARRGGGKISSKPPLNLS